MTRKSTKAATASRERATETPEKQRHLDQADLFLNRELSWLQFNARVLEEALDPSNPLLERVKFLAIFSSNLDEFFMIRVAGLSRQMTRGVLSAPPDGMTPTAQLAAIRETVVPMLEKCARIWHDELWPQLRQAGVKVLAYEELKSKQRRLLRQHFEKEIFPALTPLAFDPGHPFPHISNLSVNLAVVVNRPGHGESFARLKVPQIFPRLLRVPSEEKAGKYDRLGLEGLSSYNFVWLEEVIAHNLDVLFPGVEVVASFPFRVTRDADFEIEEDEASDLLEAMEEVVGQRHFGYAVRLEVDNRTPERIRDILVQNLEIQPYQAYALDGPMGMSSLMELLRVDRAELKDPPFQAKIPHVLQGEEGLFTTLRRRQILLYHPYESFHPVVDFVRAAARDPDVVTIKQTLYRVGADSPIVQALMEARENGKQVAVLVELKARFDESNNIVWARALERAGVHVAYGLVGLKIHAKMCLVVRREKEGLKRYVHLGTGNYNPETARIYTDFGYFTTDPDIAADVSDLFNGLTGYSLKRSYRKLLVAPRGMREGILKRIEREIEQHEKNGGGRLAFKLNALVDKRSIKALYRASQAGVKIDLQIRGVCCLRPGVPGVSENITVTSVVGRFLEHTRLFYFRNGGDEEWLLGSADLMPRNLDGRVEVLVPVEDERLAQGLGRILKAHLEDNVRARRLEADGTYRRLVPGDGKAVDSQQWMLDQRGSWLGESVPPPSLENSKAGS